MADQTECIPILKALADETRWRIVCNLAKETLTVSELTGHLGATQYNISKHLRILREAGIVTSEKQGKERLYMVVPEFKAEVMAGKSELDFGCCSFRLDRRLK